MRSKGWDGADLAREIVRAGGNARPSDVSRWISGSRRPKPRTLEYIADALTVTHAEAMEAAGHIPRLPMDHLERWHSLIDPYLRRLDFSELNQADLTDNLARMIKMQEMQAGTRRPEQYNDPVELEEE